MKGFFGDLFDFDHDGELDMFEQAADFSMFANIMDENERKHDDNDADWDFDESEE